MKNLAKLVVVGVFALIGLTILVGQVSSSRTMFQASAQEANTAPTPPVESPETSSNTANSNTAVSTPMGDKKMKAEFILSQDSVSEYGDAAFNHEKHAFQKYSPDGKSVVACIECHHTDQPKSAMKPPLVTSERDVILTFDLWKTQDIKVSGCRDCHFQEGAVPDDKEMPSVVFTKDGVEDIKEYNNEIAYHINCNTCHDEAARLRPEVRKNPGFSTSKECNICHVTQ
jgi:Zn ribbon nucleic-acid-binding protein